MQDKNEAVIITLNVLDTEEVSQRKGHRLKGRKSIVIRLQIMSGI